MSDRSLRCQIVRNAKKRAIRKGVPFEITADDISIPDFCPVFNFPLVSHHGCSKDNSPTLDRIQPSRGYVPGNVAVISHKANTIKAHATAADLYAVADWLWEQEKRFK